MGRFGSATSDQDSQYQSGWRSRSLVTLVLAASLLPMTSAGSPAEAHGPCVCTALAGSPDKRIPHAYKKALVQAVTAAPGKTLEVESRAIEAIWNPRPSDLKRAATGQSSDLRPDQATVTVFENQPAVTDPAKKKAANGFSFEVPDVDPGRYLLLIYDGGEAGNHATWDRVRVISSPDSQSTSSREKDGEASGTEAWPLVVLLLGVGGLITLALFRRAHRT